MLPTFIHPTWPNLPVPDAGQFEVPPEDPLLADSSLGATHFPAVAAGTVGPGYFPSTTAPRFGGRVTRLPGLWPRPFLEAASVADTEWPSPIGSMPWMGQSMKALEKLPQHVRRGMAMAGVKVHFTGPVTDRVAGFYEDAAIPGGPSIVVGDHMGAALLRGSEAPTITHEAGHAFDDIMHRLGNGLSSSGDRFKSLCIKHKSGTEGGGGGYGEFNSDYSQSDCAEFYAMVVQLYYKTPHFLEDYDPVLFKFMEDANQAHATFARLET